MRQIEWNFRNIGMQFPGFWGYLFKMLYDSRDTFPNILGIRDTGNPLLGPQPWGHYGLKLQSLTI